ncbi:sodium-coupled neutral amino acid transporter 9 isoform X5 [Phocoena sinus]|uniref:sodium-coupled neutral amino acid transporter 9 isoform X5 n=1 Tax=Phocoena sinus TaxID=42100 RepID=UPI0013C40E8D|nr:sodium-coupled neutral amino acid transporter 9 isoform X5 [Phocoena sinus]
MANMDSDSSHLLIPEVDNEINPGPMNIQFDSSDIRSKRPFYIEPTNIVSVNDVIQRVSDHASAMNKRIHYYSRLTAPADKALVAPDHVVPAPEECYVYSPLGSAYKLQSYTEGYGKNTSLVTIFMIWNTMMGTSILSIPWGIRQAGFTTGMCVIMLMGLLTLYCCYRVVKSRTIISSVDTTTWEYPDVCRYYFGSFGQWSSLLCSLVSLIGAMIVYWVLMSNFLFNTGKFIFNFIHHINDTDAILSTNDSNPVICPSARSGDHPENGSMIFYTNDSGLQQFEKWWNKSKTVPFYLMGLLLPLLNFKSPSFFSKFNILGTVSVLYLIFLVTLKAIHLGFHLEFHWFMPTEFFVPGEGLVHCLYAGDINLFLYWSPGFCFISFTTIIQRLYRAGYLARVQLLGHIFGDVYPSIFHVLILNLVIVGAGVLMACFYPNIGGIIRYSGAACGLAFVFIYPSLIYIISLYQEERLTWPKLISHVVIIILGLANLIVQFFM